MFLTKDVPYDAVYVFHDSENCYIPCAMEQRDGNGCLVTDDGGRRVKFGAPLAVQGVVIVKEVLRNALACKIGKESAAEVDVLAAFKKCKYYFVQPLKPVPAFSPPDRTSRDFGVLGSKFMSVNATDVVKGSVDKKIKELMTVTLKEVSSLPEEGRARVLFVLVSGDCDFSSEVNDARMLQVNVAIIHSADNPLTNSMEHILERPSFASCCWLDVVAAARAAAGNPYYHGKALDPASRGADSADSGSVRVPANPGGGSFKGVPAAFPAPAAGFAASGVKGVPAGLTAPPPVPPVKSAAVRVDGQVHCCYLTIADQKAAWYAKVLSLRGFTSLVRTIHPAFFVKEPPTGLYRADDGTFHCCELVHANNPSEQAPPTPDQVREAAKAVRQELSKITVDEPLLLPGVAALQLKDNAQLRSFAQQERVFYHLPDLKAASTAAANAGATAKAPTAPTAESAPVQSTQELAEAAAALRAHILAVAAATGSAENKIAAVDMSGFYSTCSPARKALIKEMKISALCEANRGLLRYTVDACLPGKIAKGWIHAVPTEVSELLKFIHQHGEVRGGDDQRKFITAKKMGDFYGPHGAHPELMMVIKANGRSLTKFLELHGTYFELRKSAREEDGYGLIFAQISMTPGAAPPNAAKPASAPAPSVAVAASPSPTGSARVVLVYTADNTVGRDRVAKMLMSLCPPVTDTIVVTVPSSIGMVIAAEASLKSLALRHEVSSLTITRAPKSCTITLSGVQKCVADAKAAVQACLDSMETTPIAIPQEYAAKEGLRLGLRTTARALLTADMDEGGEDDDASTVSDGSSAALGSAAPSASDRCMYAHINKGKLIQAFLVFLPPPSASAQQVDDLRRNYKQACDALQEVAATYTEFFCKRSKILPSADKRNLQRRFSLYEVSFGTAGILLCGTQAAVQDAADALTVLPEQDRVERRVYNASNRSVAFLLKNKLHNGVLQSLRDAVTKAGATVTAYTGPQSQSNTALFTIEGTKAKVTAAFQAANAAEASWVESLVEKALCAGRITRAQVKYLKEENRSLLTSLSTQSGVYLKQSAGPSARNATNPTAAQTVPALRRLLKAQLGLVELYVQHGNILTIGCDAIVNPANEQLSHGGGLAKAIADAAGRAEIDGEGAQLKKLLPGGQVAMGTSVCTGAYQLTTLNKHAKVVIHAVGPRYSSGTATECANYRRCILSALDAAASTDRAQVEYLTFTLMGVGVYGWPTALAADLLVESLAEWVHAATERGQLHLKRIVLADISESSATAMALAVQRFNDRVPGLLDAMQQAALAVPVAASRQKRPLHQWYWETQYSDGAAFKVGVVMEGGRRWVPYDYDQVMQIEDALEHNTLPIQLNGDIAKVSNGVIYQIAREDFLTFDRKQAVQFTQMRISEGGIQKNFKRSVRCELFTAGMTMAGYCEDPVPVAAVDTAPAVRRGLQTVSRIDTGKGDAIAASGGLSLLGKPDDIARMELALLAALEQAKTSSAHAIDLSITAPEDWEAVLTKLRADLLEANVDAEVVPAPLAGERHIVLRACGANELIRGELEVSKFCNKAAKKLAEDAVVQWPTTWTEGPFNVQDDKVRLIDVKQGSAEWNEVEYEWRNQSVAPNATRNGAHNQLGANFTLQTVKRIQNPVAWAAYHSRVRLTASMISSDSTGSVFHRANEWVMKHGTLRTDPEEVVRSAAGIDSRYAGDNLFFGKAAYTAEDAEYSHAYAYRVPDSNGGVRQMLLVRVAAGRIHEIQDRKEEHKQIKTPPSGFHSVRGNVSQNAPRRMAIMVYQPDTAYPSYLLTYKHVQ